MDISYFQKINNTYQSKSRQETDLYLLNRHVDDCFADTVDYHVVKRNGEPFELLIIKDTDGNTFKKKIKSKNSAPFNLGDYIEWQGQIWLVTLLDPNDKTYHSGYMYLCTLPLRWQNKKGEIVERWVYVEDFTKYSSGVAANNTVQVGENQYGLTLPMDSETKQLKRDKRFVIDFEEYDTPDVYALTNRKVALNNDEYFGRGGTIVLTVSYDNFNVDTDKKVRMENGKEVWVCDYKEPSSPTLPPEPDETSDLTGAISGVPELKVGFERSYTASVERKDGKPLDSSVLNLIWKVQSDFSAKIQQTVSGDKITLLVEDESLIGSSFVLQYLADDVVIAEIEITITDVI